MNKDRFAGATIEVAACALLGARAFSQPPKEEQKESKPSGRAAPGPEQMAEMMKKWQAIASPGEQHKKLSQFVGSWNTTMKVFMGGPDSPATESKGTSEVKPVLDGRFIMEEWNGEMKMPGADGKETSMPHVGVGLTGYDKYKNMYVSCWADSMGTQLLTMMGSADPTGKIFTAYGQMDEPMLDVHGRMVKYVTRIIDDKKRVFEIFDLHAGPDYKVVEITYERK